MASAQLLNLLHEMALMHQLAKKGDWQKFQPLEEKWLVQFQQTLAQEPLPEAEKKVILETLLQQVQEIEQFVQQAMHKLHAEHEKGKQQRNAIHQYLTQVST